MKWELKEKWREKLFQISKIVFPVSSLVSATNLILTIVIPQVWSWHLFGYLFLLSLGINFLSFAAWSLLD